MFNLIFFCQSYTWIELFGDKFLRHQNQLQHQKLQ